MGKGHASILALEVLLVNRKLFLADVDYWLERRGKNLHGRRLGVQLRRLLQSGAISEDAVVLFHDDALHLLENPRVALLFRMGRLSINDVNELTDLEVRALTNNQIFVAVKDGVLPLPELKSLVTTDELESYASYLVATRQLLNYGAELPAGQELKEGEGVTSFPGASCDIISAPAEEIGGRGTPFLRMLEAMRASSELDFILTPSPCSLRRADSA